MDDSHHITDGRLFMQIFPVSTLPLPRDQGFLVRPVHLTTWKVAIHAYQVPLEVAFDKGSGQTIAASLDFQDNHKALERCQVTRERYSGEPAVVRESGPVAQEIGKGYKRGSLAGEGQS